MRGSSQREESKRNVIIIGRNSVCKGQGVEVIWCPQGGTVRIPAWLGPSEGMGGGWPEMKPEAPGPRDAAQGTGAFRH